MLSQLPEASRYTVQQNNSFGGSQFLRPSKLTCSSSSTAVAQQRRSSHVADYAKGVGALVSANRIPEAVSLLERSLDKQRKLHALSTGDLLEGELQQLVAVDRTARLLADTPCMQQLYCCACACTRACDFVQQLGPTRPARL